MAGDENMSEQQSVTSVPRHEMVGSRLGEAGAAVTNVSVDFGGDHHVEVTLPKGAKLKINAGKAETAAALVGGVQTAAQERKEFRRSR